MENKSKPIGGYFGWEFPMSKRQFPHEDGYLVASCRGALQLLLLHVGKVSKVYIPYYTCDSVTNALDQIGVRREFYHVNDRLELAAHPVLGDNEYIVYTNYFGIKDGYIPELLELYGNHLIIDNAQALFAPAISGCHQIYSPRKFVGVSDGGILVSSVSIDTTRLPIAMRHEYCSHLLKRAEGLVSDGYSDFKASDHTLCDQSLYRMSAITTSVLHSLDYDAIKHRRNQNFAYLHSRLASTNAQSDIIADSTCPMVYPYYVDDAETLRSSLISNQIFVAKYWPNVQEWCSSNDLEYQMCQHILPLPIDQRYDDENMERIIKIITNK